MDAIDDCRQLSDEELVAGLERLASQDRKTTEQMLGHLAVMDEREIGKKRGYSSLYLYCVKKMRFSEACAYKRIQTARLAVRYRRILQLVRDGEASLATLLVIGPHLNNANVEEMLTRIARKSRREVEMIAASLAPGPARKDVMAPTKPMGTAHWPAQAPLQQIQPQQPISFTFDKIEAVDGERQRLHFDVGPETAKLLERAREVMRHKYPMASFEDIVKEALKLLLDEKDPELKLKLDKENAKEVLTAARQVPVWVRRKVWRRDGGRCAYVAADGTRCEEKSRLEYDHVIPYAKGGRSDDPGNIRLLCRAHNQMHGWLAFGATSSA